MTSKESLARLLNDGLIGTRHVSSAGLVHRKDGKVRAAVGAFKINDHEIKGISVGFKDVAHARQNPVVVNGTAYQCIRADSTSMYAKTGKRGLIIARTAVHFIIALYDDGMHPSICVEAVETLAQYFRDKAQ